MMAIVISHILLINWMRSKQGIFFSIIFPIILLLIFGSVFGNKNAMYELYIQNLDIKNNFQSSELSEKFIKALNDTKILEVKKLELWDKPDEIIKNSQFENKRILIIPERFQKDVTNGKKIEIQILGKSGDPYFSIVSFTVKGVAKTFNINHSMINDTKINVTEKFVIEEEVTAVDYYLPGILSSFIMVNGIIGVTLNLTEFRRSGIIKRLAATPLRKYDWILGNVLYQTLLAFILTLIMLFFAKIVFDFNKIPDLYSISLILLGSITFCAMGIFIGSAIKDIEAATGIGNAIAYPMMFLSGAFWPIELMPKYLQTAAKFLPLYYLHNGLRMSMIYNNTDHIFVSFIVLGVLGFLFLLLAVKVTKWQDF